MVRKVLQNNPRGSITTIQGDKAMTALENYKLTYEVENAKTRRSKTTANQTYKAERAGRISNILRQVFQRITHRGSTNRTERVK